MLAYYSMKTFLRTPLRGLVFLLLMISSSFLLVSGTNLWIRSHIITQRYEDTFKTIGTVRQKPIGVELERMRLPVIGGYIYMNRAVYGQPLPVEILHLEGVDFILTPEKRPFYGSLTPELQLHIPAEKELWGSEGLVAKLRPVACGDLREPLELIIEEVLWSSHNLEVGMSIWVEEFFSDSNQTFYSENQYMMALHSFRSPKGEFVPGVSINPTQFTPEGQLIEADFYHEFFQKIDDDFYGSGAHNRWNALAYSMDLYFISFPVLPTHGIDLLLPFHLGRASIIEGEMISEEEFLTGLRVCLIPEEMARRNGLVPGDTIYLELFYSNHRGHPSEYFSYGTYSMRHSLINSEGEVYSTFLSYPFVIRGIYRSVDLPGVRMGDNTVVIPALSMQECDGNNILAYGPMQHSTTSFQIPNGSIDDFLNTWNATEYSRYVEIAFYDGGYTHLRQGLRSIREISYIFLFVGGILAILLSVFFSHLFVTKQKYRMVTERMLGLTKKESALSLLSGMLVVNLIGILIGILFAFFSENHLIENIFILNPVEFDRTFSIGTLQATTIDISQVMIPASYSVVAGLLFWGLSSLVAFLFAYIALKKEIMLVKSKEED